MGIYSSAYLKGVASRKQKIFEQKMFRGRDAPESTVYDIFLSHSFLDKIEVQ